MKNSSVQPGKKMAAGTALGLLNSLKEAAENIKAADIKTIDVSSYDSCGSYYLILSASSPPHTSAIVRELTGVLKKMGFPPVKAEGTLSKQWVLLDCRDVIVHIFSEQARAFYDIERLWREPFPAK